MTTTKEDRMGRLIIHNAVTINGAFEAPDPDKWLVLDADSSDASLEQLVLADAMVLGRKTYEGLAAVWPHLGDDPTLGRYAERINSMPKYVASRSLTRAAGVECHPARGRPRRQRARPQGQAPAEPDRLRVRRAGPCPHHPGPGRRVLVLGEPLAVGERPADLRRRRAGPAATGQLHGLSLGGAVAALPASVIRSNAGWWRAQMGGLVTRGNRACAVGTGDGHRRARSVMGLRTHVHAESWVGHDRPR